MPQKKNKKTQKQPSPKKNTKNHSKVDSKINEAKQKRASSPLHRKSNNRLFQSVGALSFQNKKIKHVLSQKSQPKSSTQRDVSTGIFQEIRPNREYYGQQTSLYIHNKCQSSSNFHFSKRTSKLKRPKNGKILSKILRSYRSLQRSHSQQLQEYSHSATKNELHRLRRMQESELRRQMQKLVEIEWKSLYRRR